MLLKGVVILKACNQHLNFFPKSSAAGKHNCISSKPNCFLTPGDKHSPHTDDRQVSLCFQPASKQKYPLLCEAWKTTAVSTSIISSWKCSILHRSIQHYL